MFFKGEIPFVRFIIPLILGIALAMWFPSAWVYQYSFVSILGLLGVLIGQISLYQQLSLFKRRWIPGLTLHLFLALLGYFITLRTSQVYAPNHFSCQASEALIVKLINEPKLNGDILRFETEVMQSAGPKQFESVCGKLLIALKVDSLNPVHLEYGNLLLIPGTFNEVEPPYNPGEFDFKAYLASRQIYHQTFINQKQILVLKKDAGNPLIAFARGLRKQLVEKFYRFLPDKDAAALASTLILGYRADLSKEVIQVYSKTGTMHVLAVSGMHVGIVFLVLNFLFKPLNRSRKLRFLQTLLMIQSIWFYALITGFSPSVCRAALMLSFVLLGKAFHRSQNTYNLLAISAFFLLLYNPFYLLDVGFQLSYLAVIGLVYFQPKIYGLWSLKNKILDGVWSYCSLSAAAQLATFPISMYYFHQFPVYFLLANLFIAWPVALIMYAGIALLFIPWEVVLKPLGWCLSWLIDFSTQVLFYIESMPFSSLGGIWINTFQYLLIYLFILGLIWANTRADKKLLTASLGVLLLLTSSFSYKTIVDYSRHELIFYSLRKNTAIAYIRQGQGVLISDLEAGDKTMDFSIKPAFESRNIGIGKILRPGDDFSGESLQISSDFMRFGNFKVLRWTKDFDHFFDKRIRVDALLLSGNPRVDVKTLKRYVDFGTLLLDATNPDYRIEQWQQEAKELGLEVRVLKKNPAYVVKL